MAAPAYYIIWLAHHKCWLTEPSSDHLPYMFHRGSDLPKHFLRAIYGLLEMTNLLYQVRQLVSTIPPMWFSQLSQNVTGKNVPSVCGCTSNWPWTMNLHYWGDRGRTLGKRNGAGLWWQSHLAATDLVYRRRGRRPHAKRLCCLVHKSALLHRSNMLNTL